MIADWNATALNVVKSEEVHPANALSALGVVNRTEAIVALHRLGFSLEMESDRVG